MLHKRILLVRDENALGNVYNELKLNFDKIEVSVRDIIIERVFQEVQKYNEKAVAYKFALVQPKEDEMRLNHAKEKKKKLINVEKQVEIALKAFDSNGFFILLDERQIEDIEEIVTLKADTIISFIKLTPLVGG
ncbi:MAG: hypothetical protein GQ583_12980 [Methyloprofundus sp.]|nr:hypothetical protein [Methyloprofundus sp.]